MEKNSASIEETTFLERERASLARSVAALGRTLLLVR